MAAKTRKYVLRSHFSGFPQRDALEIIEEDLPPIKDGGECLSSVPPQRPYCVMLVCAVIRQIDSTFLTEFLCEAQWISVDPYMR